MNTVVLIITVVIIVGLNMWVTNRSRRYMNQLIEQQTSNPQVALTKLNKWYNKLLIPYYQRSAMQMNCYSALNEDDKLEQLFDSFNKKVQSKRTLVTVRDKAMVYQKEISHYIHHKNSDKAKAVNHCMQALQSNDEFTNSLINESNDCIQIYLDHNFAYLDKGKQIVTNHDNSVFKGIWHYRLAYLYWIKNASKEVNHHLNLAKSLLKESEIYPLVEKVAKNYTLFDTTIL